MTTRWTVDSCDCIIDFNNNGNWVNSFKKCRHHNHLNGQAHLKTVQSQNRRFNSAFADPLTENQIELIIVAKQLNKLRIRVESKINFNEH